MKNLLIIFAVIVFVVQTSTAQRKGEIKLEPYVFRANTGEQVKAEYGRLYVPENRSKSKSRLIELAFVRFKSTSMNPGFPVVYLVGGPGSSAINQARGNNFQMYMALREAGDLILLDQRGTGLSKPALDCTERLDYQPDRPFIPDEMIENLKRKSSECAARLRREGVDLSGYNTNENADDVEDLRKALGAEKLNLFGTSYGTHLAVNVIKRHGANLDRVVLAGVEGPDHTYKLPENIERNLEQIFSLYKSDAAISKRIPDFKTLIINLMNQLEKHPAMVELTDPETKQKVVVTVGRYDLQYLLAGYLPGRIAAIRNFPKIAYQMSKGDFSFIAGTMLAARRSALGSAMKFMMDCSSGASQKRQQLIKRQGRQAIVGDFANYPYPQICQAWQGTKLSKDFYKPVKSQTPVLLISGTLDGRTPASNAEEIIKGFPNGFHLLVEGAGHVDSSMFLPKVQESLLKFLKGESLNETEFTAKALEFAPIP